MESLHQRRQFWSEQVQQWQSSGLSQREFCRQRNLKARQLAYWAGRHRQQTENPSLLPVRVLEPPARLDGMGILLRHDSGWSLHLPQDVEGVWLGTTLRALAGC